MADFALPVVRQEVTTEPVPCGESITTRYYNAAGNLIRQDVEIRVLKPATLGSHSGEMGG